MYYWEWAFNIVQVDTLFNYINYTTFTVIFYVAIMVVILVITDIIYVSYSFQQKKFKYVWPLKLLRTFCGLLVTVFFLNFLGNIPFCYNFLNRTLCIFREMQFKRRWDPRLECDGSLPRSLVLEWINHFAFIICSSGIVRIRYHLSCGCYSSIWN